MPELLLSSGPEAGRRIALTDEVVLGREEADVSLDDPEVSRRHVALKPVPDGVEIRDLGSKNGTRVDGRRIDGSVVVTRSARVEIGTTEFEVVVEVRAEETRASVRPAETALSERPSQETRVAKPSEPSAPSAAPPAAVTPAPVMAAQNAPAPGEPLPEFGAFRGSSESRRTAAPASRLLLPSLVTFAVIVATAVALVLYFTMR